MTPKNTPPGVTLDQLAAAKAQAIRTGKPVPIMVNGQAVAVVRPDDRHRGQTTVDALPGEQHDLAPVTQTVTEAKAKQPQVDDRAKANAAISQMQAGGLPDLTQKHSPGGPVWVNGQMATVTGFHSDGTPIIGYLGSKAGTTPDPGVGPAGTTAFDALHLGAPYGPTAGIDAGDRFIMAKGPTDINTGMPANPSGYQPSGLGDHSYSANVVPNGTSQMTIAQGVQWLVNLANQSPHAYDALVNQLKHAGYTGSQGEPLTGGAYSETVGVAFAKAAKDLSVQQQTTGSSMGLDDFLSARSAAVKKAAEDATPLVQRNYTDQGTLLANAKSAAEQALGRQLNSDELARFEQSFRGQEDTYYNQVDAYNKAKAGAGATGDNTGTGGFNATSPDASGQAEALVHSDQYGQERANYSAGNYYQAIAQMFGIK